MSRLSNRLQHVMYFFTRIGLKILFEIVDAIWRICLPLSKLKGSFQIVYAVEHICLHSPRLRTVSNRLHDLTHISLHVSEFVHSLKRHRRDTPPSLPVAPAAVSEELDGSPLPPPALSRPPQGGPHPSRCRSLSLPRPSADEPRPGARSGRPLSMQPHRFVRARILDISNCLII